MSEELEETEKFLSEHCLQRCNHNSNESCICKVAICLKEIEKAQEQEKENIKLKGQMKYLGEIITNFQKVLKIINEKNVDIWVLKSCLTLEQYNFSITQMDNCSIFNLIQEEFDLLKEVF